MLTSIFAITALSYRIGYMPLSADEPIRALIALDMEYNQHYVAPEINGDPYYKKPPLYNWILLGFFKLFGSHAEWVVRLPSLLSAFLFVGMLWRMESRRGGTHESGLFLGLAWLTGGNLLFYSSYLGHIDITYSLITFMGIYSLFYFGERGRWTAMYTASYLAAAAGFMMKGLPSILFQGLSLLIYVFFFQTWKDLLRRSHLLGLIAFAIPLGVYLYFFSRQQDIGLLSQTLLEESTSRTVGDKPIWQSIEHLFTFPFNYIIDILPYGLILPALLIPGLRRIVVAAVKQDRFLRFCLFVFLGNIWVYWLAPDYRARYVFMLTPFLLFVLLPVFQNMIRPKNMLWTIIGFFAVIVVGSIVLLVSGNSELPEISKVSWIAAVSVLLTFILFRSQYMLLIVPVILLSARMLYTETVLPARVAKSPFELEKQQAQDIAVLTKGSELEMYHSNVNLTMAWYLAIERGDIPITQRYPVNMEAFYLVPSDVLTDSENIDTYYTFVRRHLHKPFQLVRFRHYFPEMPKYE